MDVDGWHPDPYGIHEERLFAHGEPTPLVRDDGIGSFDAPPVTATGSEPETDASASAPLVGATAAGASAAPAPAAAATAMGRRRGTGSASGTTAPGTPLSRPTKPMLALAALLIAAGAVVGILGISGAGGSGDVTTTTQNPLVRTFLHLPKATIPLIPPQQNAQALPTTTDLAPLEQALRALPRTTTPPAAPATTPRVTTPPKTAASAVTQPPKRAPVASSIVPATTLPLTTMTTSVGQADEAWYVAYGSTFNLVQTDIEKLDRALGSSSPSVYTDVHPYWQELRTDAVYASSMPPIPDAGSQASWTGALNDLSEGGAECIIGSIGSPGSAQFVPTIFNQGAALITAGTTELDAAITSVESLASATSAPSRPAVRGWNQSHSAVLSSLQADITKLNATFASAGTAGDSAVIPDWQQLANDAQSAMKLTPIPDPLLQAYWTTALSDLVQGASDCIGSEEALPPNLFDQGVASIDSGSGYLNTTLGAIQSLVA